MKLPLTRPPQSLCLLRLSAVGDICHALPVVRTLQREWPQTRNTWIIGRLEYSLVGDIPGIEFIIFDKSKGLSAFRELRNALKGRQFDVLLHMQMSLRASIAALLVNADIKLGFNRAYAGDLQWMFTSHKAQYREHQHVMDSFFNFIETLGVTRRELVWDIPVPPAARAFARQVLPGDQPLMVISPCSSMSYRNWQVEGYAAVADYAQEHHGLAVVLTGGPSEIERDYGERISAAVRHPIINLIGRTDLKQLTAVISRAVCVVAPDSGPAHLATTVNVPVIGLYATTNPDRARPYLSADYTIDRYREAVQDKCGKPPEELPWGIRVRDAGTMERIAVADVTGMLDRLMAAHTAKI
ncbi:MAG: glycosyltransferase family 9 protein [Pseudomonadota bacterium]|nr:MAG: glycosyltransferase family 9 protein [Pseudomonadota bacterium]